MLSSLMVGATQAKTHTTYQTVVVSTSGDVPVPANCDTCYVTAIAAGGENYFRYGGSGGAAVDAFPIGVTAEGVVSVVVGNTQQIGGLTLQAGSVGNVNRAAGGTVTYGGVQPPESSIVISGGYGGGTAENGGDAGIFTGGTSSSSVSGGGASAGGNGGDANKSAAESGSIFGSGAGGHASSSGVNAAGTFSDVVLKFEIVTVV